MDDSLMSKRRSEISPSAIAAAAALESFDPSQSVMLRQWLDVLRRSPVEPIEAVPTPEGNVDFNTPPPQKSEGARLRHLEREKSELELKLQLVKSQLADARRETAKWSQKFDQLLAHLDSRSKNEQVQLKALLSAQKAASATFALLECVKGSTAKLIESYSGLVVSSDEKSLLVAFEIDGDIVEHFYEKEQLCDLQLPATGEVLRVFVHLATAQPDANDLGSDEPVVNDFPRRTITEDVEF